MSLQYTLLSIYTYLLFIFLSFFVSYYDKARLPRTINALGNNRLYIEQTVRVQLYEQIFWKAVFFGTGWSVQLANGGNLFGQRVPIKTRVWTRSEIQNIQITSDVVQEVQTKSNAKKQHLDINEKMHLIDYSHIQMIQIFTRITTSYRWCWDSGAFSLIICL